MRFSVILISYNQRGFVREAAESVLRSSCRDLELVCVDDGSVDGTVGVLHALASEDARVRVVAMAHSGRPAVARNEGIRHARGEYLLFLDGDDLYHEDRLAALAAALDACGDADVLFNDYADFLDGSDPRGASPRIAGDRIEEALHAIREGSWHSAHGARACRVQADRLAALLVARAFIINTDTICIRRAHFVTRVLWFPEDRVFGEDTVVWLRAIVGGRVHYVDATLSFYRKHPSSLTRRRTPSSQRQLLRSMVELYDVAVPVMTSEERTSAQRHILREAMAVGTLLEEDGRVAAAVGSYGATAWRFRSGAPLVRLAKALVRPMARRLGVLGVESPKRAA